MFKKYLLGLLIISVFGINNAISQLAREYCFCLFIKSIDI